MIHTGDCLDVMPSFDAESVDAIVTDPPYGLGFMGKAWDGAAGPGGLGDVPMRRRAELNKVNTGVGRQGGRQRSTADFAKRQARDAREYQAWCESWAVAAFRVAKPGAHLLAFGGTRTYHRLASAIEDAGWELRDCLVWAYASGFPKSHNLDGDWTGWGTALKPAWEPIVMARKPLLGTVAANMARHRTGALNIDGTRIAFVSSSDAAAAAAAAAGYADSLRRGTALQSVSIGRESRDGTEYEGPDERGRWPANVILTDPIFDGDTQGVVGGGETNRAWTAPSSGRYDASGYHLTPPAGAAGPLYGDEGTYSRFFLIPKADRADREPLVGGSLDLTTVRLGVERLHADPTAPSGRRSDHPRENVHPTVKPTDLMRHLVRLVTPPGGLVLDPFLGSGTTAIAAEMEGFHWIGIEREAEYVAIAEARLNGTQKGLGLVG